MRRCRRSLVIAAAALAVWAAAVPVAYGRLSGQDPSRDKRQPATADFKPPKLWERVEITLFGGLGIPIAKLTTIHYTETASAAGLAATAENRIQTASKSDIFFGAGATFFLRSGIGLQAGFGYLKSDLEIENAFRYAAPGTSRISYAAADTGRGELTAVPIFFCLFNKFEVKIGAKALRAYVTAGPAFFLNSVLAEVRGGAALIQADKADAFLIPVAVADTTWVSFGATAGLGLDLPLSKSLALTVEGRYFYSQKKNFAWTWTPGVYNGVFGEISGFDFDSTTAARYDRDTTRLTIDPSLIQVACGIKIIF